MKAPLVSKNRAANELREQAHALRSQLADPTATFTADEVEKRLSDIRAIEMRAQAAAEFTPDAEVSRQGGDETLVRVNAAGDREQVDSMAGAVDQARAILKDAGIRNLGQYVRAVAKGPANAAEAAALNKMDLMTRTITGSTNGGEYLLPLT